MLALMGMGLIPQVAHAEIVPCRTSKQALPEGVLFQNVRIFNGLTDGLSGKSDVLVIGNKINKISLTPIILAPEDYPDVTLSQIATIDIALFKPRRGARHCALTNGVVHLGEHSVYDRAKYIR